MNTMSLLAEVDMNSVLNNGMSATERLTDGGRMILLGMAAVFAVLFVIWLLLTVFRFFIYDIPRMQSGGKKNPVQTAKISEDSAMSAGAAVIPEADNGQLVAVITAAISAMRSEEGSGGIPFKVVSFSRKNRGMPWNR